MNKKILIVDDEKSIREFYKRIVEITLRGHNTVLLASDVDSAIQLYDEQIPEHKPDLNIVDFIMPGMNGDRYVDYLLRQENPDYSIPYCLDNKIRPEIANKIIVATGTPNFDPVINLEKLGVEVLAKPFSLSSIEDLLKRKFDLYNKNI